MTISAYFDYNATTPVCDEARTAMTEAFDVFANPSASYRLAAASKDTVDDARVKLAALIGAEPQQVFFTSGGTEANNWALYVALRDAPEGKTVYCSAIEHDAVLVTARELCSRHRLDFRCLFPRHDGVVCHHDVQAALDAHPACLVSVMLANNETGALQPVKDIADAARASGAFFHVDAVQAVGKIPVDVKALNCDSMSISGHKFYAPKGIGALYIRDPDNFSPWMLGGAQEKGMRSGTENIIGIAGIGAAAAVAAQEMDEQYHRMSGRRALLLASLEQRGIGFTLNGTSEEGCHLPNTLNLSFENVRAEALAALLTMRFNTSVSIGSACGNNKQTRQSHVLRAMHLDEDRMNGAMRISFGKYTAEDDIIRLADNLRDALAHLHQLQQAAA